MNEKIVEHFKVPESIIEKWQRLIDALARLLNVPTALIMKIELPYLRALISSNTKGNAIPSNYKEEIYGKYCEETIQSKKLHEVPNALKDPNYKNKPGLESNKLIFYLGFPLEWPTGDVFGTICILDKKERYLSQEQKDVMREMKVSVDAHLELIYKNELLKKAQQKIKYQRDNLRLLNSTIQHDIANNLTYIKGFLELKQSNSELPKDFSTEFLPYLQNSIESINNIKKLEDLFTKKKTLREMQPKKVIQKIKNKYSKNLKVKGSCTVKADEFLNLLLKELIRNAFKHTNTPKVELLLSENETQSIIEIQDFGPGLPDEIVISYFKDNNSQRELKGLTLVQKIMKRYDGIITYERNSKGALFKLIWPKTSI
ncbi:MAG: hypothetical protein GF383_10760 [Candidatus Lokiarchaeota archaeon]|nr:hypothetical protein [Candidatus Lokiarchaeota archaeon]MBD3341085.1 hypothetical protein [Candidatus Lokiarchaeota archaeon]